MGNHRFRLSDMMPNAWFYKLRDMSKLKNHNPSHPINKNLPSSIQNPRKSFYYTADHNSIRMDNNLCKNPKFFDTPFPYDPPRKSKKLKSKRKTIYMPSPRKIIFQEPDDSSVGLQHGPGFDVPTSDDDQEFFLESLSEFDDDHSLDDGHDQSMSSCSCSKLSSSATDIIIDMDESYSSSTFSSINIERFTEFTELPPIVTKPGNKESPKLKNKNTSAEFPAEKVKRNRTSPGGRKSVSGGVKIQGKGRRSKKVETGRRKSVKCGEKKAGMFYSESFAIVKASIDPEKDFRESMMEMIVENNIRESKDLEDLLACYLSLNSNQYHHLIIKSFEQIWFNMPRLQF